LFCSGEHCGRSDFRATCQSASGRHSTRSRTRTPKLPVFGLVSTDS
jgi:hypothetical protein